MSGPATTVYRAVLVVIDHEGLGPEEVRRELEKSRYLSVSVHSADSREIDWSDAHPLNNYSTSHAEFERLFFVEPSPAPVQPETPIMRPMKTDDGRKGWYVNGRGFFLDIEKDKDGKWSAFFRDSATGREAFADQAESVQPQAEPVAWATIQKIDGSEILEKFEVASNPDYIKVHREWLWVPLYAGAAPVAPEQTPRIPDRAWVSDAPSFLNTNDKALWATGWNACRNAAMKGTP